MKVLRVWVLALCLLPAFCLAQAANEVESVDKLMKLMNVDAVLQASLNLAEKDQRLKQLPEATRQCILTAVSGGQVRDEMRVAYLKVFKDARTIREAIEFLESPVGTKIVDAVVSSIQASDSLQETATINPEIKMTQQETAEFDRFAMTDSGKAFINAPAILEAHRNEVTPRLVRQCVPDQASP